MHLFVETFIFKASKLLSGSCPGSSIPEFDQVAPPFASVQLPTITT